MANKTSVKFSEKYGLIDKANTTMLVAVSLAVAVVCFSIIASRSLVKQISYQNKVIDLRKKADKQLDKNLKAVDTLVVAYKTFDGASENVIGTTEKNPKVILDALPSKYDFPALITSLEGLIKDSGAQIQNITGTDNEEAAEQESINPKPVEMAFEISAEGSLPINKVLVDRLERSIRPIQATKIVLTAKGTNVSIKFTGKTYYQPEKKIGIQNKVVPGEQIKPSKTQVKK